MQIRQFLVISSLATGLAACSSNEIGNSKDVAQESIYQQYSISYSEGDEKAAINAQFRFGGKNGTTLLLNNPSSISFDGTTIKVDSSDFGGAFYQVNKPVANFYGTHHFIFTDINNKKFDNDFVFEKFGLVNAPSAAAKTASLQLQFDSAGLRAGDEVTVSSSDTDSSFSVTGTVSDKNFTISIPAEDIKRQKGKELKLDISLHRNVPLQQNSKEGGELNISYRLKPVKINFTDKQQPVL
jgi:hypothetical protein